MTESATERSRSQSREPFILPDQADNIEPDPDSSAYEDSALGDFDPSSTASISSSVLNFKYENGRGYGGDWAPDYMLPIDEKEQDRTDLSHHVFRMVLGGALYRCPLPPNPRNILDIGTGTRIWAIDIADEFPSASVIGCDLSPIQPTWVPPNCQFQVDDVEKPWSYSKRFDFIHGRSLAGSIANWPSLFARAYENLEPGGWLELQGFEISEFSDDGTLEKATNSILGRDKTLEASEKIGKDMKVVHKYADMMKEAGFVDIVDDVYKVPLSPWPKDKRLKKIARYQQLVALESVETYSLALLTRVLGWSHEEVQVLVALVKNEIRDLSIYAYCKMHFVYGRKPTE